MCVRRRTMPILLLTRTRIPQQQQQHHNHQRGLYANTFMLHTCIEIHARWLRAHEHDVSRPSEISTHSENPINVYATKREAFIIPSLARWPRRTRRTHAISEYKCLVCVCMRASVCARSFDYLHVMQRLHKTYALCGCEWRPKRYYAIRRYCRQKPRRRSGGGEGRG